MKSIQNIIKRLDVERKEKLIKENLQIDPPPIVDYMNIQIDKEYPRAMCNYLNLKIIPNKELIDPNINFYYYNSSICKIPETDNYRLFYRVSKKPKGYDDRIATCVLNSNMDVINSSNKYLELYSNWDESVYKNFNFIKMMNVYKFKNGYHIEDPRAILFNDNWFLLYTDGFNILVAKLKFDTCETVYSHYIFKPNNLRHDESDGREKNWIPFVANNKLYILYSDNPRTIFECKDIDTELKIINVFYSDNTNLTIWNYGNIRGGTPPCEYDENHFIWFFHCQKQFNTTIGLKKVYMIGAYVSKNSYPFDVVKISQLPLLIGIPAPTSRIVSYQDFVVYPCGAIKTKTGWTISMGIHDYNNGLLNVTENDFLWKNSITFKYFPFNPI